MTNGQGRRFGLAVACAALVAACGPPGGAVTTTAVPGASPTIGVVATTVDAVVAAPADGALAGIAADGERLLVAGADPDGPAVWSRDGAKGWRRDEVRQPGLAPRMHAVAVDGRRGVAFGGDGGQTSRVWVRNGDDVWWPVPAAEADIRGRVNAVTVDGDRWLAAGDAVDPEAGEAYEGMVWTSRDGRTFRPLAKGLDLAEGTVTDVAAADGVVVVVGFDVTGGRVWSSDGDGFAPAAGTFGAMTMHGVAATSDGFIIIGRGVGDLAPRAWRSADGRTWELLDIAGTGVAADEELHDATTYGDAVIAVGGSPSAGVIWTLDDGQLVRGDS